MIFAPAGSGLVAVFLVDGAHDFAFQFAGVEPVTFAFRFVLRFASVGRARFSGVGVRRHGVGVRHQPKPQVCGQPVGLVEPKRHFAPNESPKVGFVESRFPCAIR